MKKLSLILVALLQTISLQAQSKLKFSSDVENSTDSAVVQIARLWSSYIDNHNLPSLRQSKQELIEESNR